MIFGGTAGIGLATARTLGAAGADVLIAGRRPARAEAAAAALTEHVTGRVVPFACDLGRSGAAEDAVAAAVEKFGGLRGMAVTTGLGLHGQRSLLAASDDDWAITFDDVLMTVSRACRAAVPVLIESGGGSIVTTSAYSIRSPKGHQVPYGALKAGVATLTKALAKTYGADGVRANSVCPGATETEILAGMRTRIAAERGWAPEHALERVMAEDWGMEVALGRAGRPEEIGDVIAFLLSERASYITGSILNVDGGTDF